MHTPHALHHQSGIVLIISLIILILLTIIGVSGMKVTSLEEKMAGNDRNQSVTFQAAETALRIGEAQAKKIYDNDDLELFCNNTRQQGLYCNLSTTCGSKCTLPNPMDSATWTDANSVPVGNSNLLTGTTARYYITYYYYYYYRDPEQPLNNRYYYYFTVTARGAGASGGEVVLRSYFGGKLPPRE